MADIKELQPGLKEADVVTKYKMGAEMANRKCLSDITLLTSSMTTVLVLGVVKTVTGACVAGAKALDLCRQGDELMEKETGSVFNKKVEGKLVPKGIAFPTCVSVNNVLFHCSPLDSEEDFELQDGDLVKM